jgi:hypothetical protein
VAHQYGGNPFTEGCAYRAGRTVISSLAQTPGPGGAMEGPETSPLFPVLECSRNPGSSQEALGTVLEEWSGKSLLEIVLGSSLWP